MGQFALQGAVLEFAVPQSVCALGRLPIDSVDGAGGRCGTRLGAVASLRFMLEPLYYLPHYAFC